MVSRKKLKYQVGDLIISRYSKWGIAIGIIVTVRLDPLYTDPIDSLIVIKWNDLRGKIGYGVPEIDTCIENRHWEYDPVKLDKKTGK